jgi:hypothetical protein
MRTRWLPLLLLLAVMTWIGCGPKSDETTTDTAKPNAPIDNSSPAAQSAPAAPGPGPDVPRPGGGKKQ